MSPVGLILQHWCCNGKLKFKKKNEIMHCNNNAIYNNYRHFIPITIESRNSSNASKQWERSKLSNLHILLITAEYDI